jgi:hypothetical protein
MTSDDEICSPGVGGVSANANPRPQSAKHDPSNVAAVSAPNRFSFRFTAPVAVPARFATRAGVAVCFQFPKLLLMKFSMEGFLKLVAIAVRA